MSTRSANASPSIHGFHYAPSRSPRHSSSCISVAAAAVCRPSSCSPPTVPLSSRPLSGVDAPVSPARPPARPPACSSAPSKPHRYVAVDAATQYSPMEPFDYAAPRPTPSAPVAGAGEPGVEPAPHRQPPAASPAPADHKKPSASLAPAQPPPAQTASPAKRRGADEPPAPEAAAAADPEHAAASPSSLVHSPLLGSKRARPEARPPKILPERYELCATEDMVVLIANMLGELIETNDALALKAGHLTRFHSRTPPGISVLDYLNRLAKHATLSPPLLLSMVYYIDRLCAMYPDFTINTLTVHRFLITAATVAAKGLSDSFWNNSTYARVGGVRVAELKMLELEFLYRLEWKIVPNPEVLAAYYRPLVERCLGYALPLASHDASEDDIDSSASAAAATPASDDKSQSSTSLIGRDLLFTAPGPAKGSGV